LTSVNRLKNKPEYVQKTENRLEKEAQKTRQNRKTVKISWLIRAVLAGKKNMEKRINILIATGIYPPEIGGPATMIGALAAALEKRNFKVKIITYSSSRSGKEENVSRIKKRGVFGRAEYLIRFFLAAFSADLVYATDTYSVGYFAYLAKKLIGREYVLRFAGDSAWESAVSRDLTEDYITDFAVKNYGGEIERWKSRRKKILLAAGKIIAVSEFMARLAELIGADKNQIEIIHNSIDFKAGKSGAPEEIKNRFRGRKIIVTACRLAKWKGVAGLIRTMARMKSEGMNPVLLVLGDGPEEKKLKALAKETGLEDTVFFEGRVNADRVAAYFRAADLFVLNTFYEGLSHTLLEALEAGLPAAVSDIDGNREVIEDGKNGLLFRFDDEKEIGEKIKKILKDPDLIRTFGEAGRKTLEKFSWEKNLGQTESLIKKLVYEKNSSHQSAV